MSRRVMGILGIFVIGILLVLGISTQEGNGKDYIVVEKRYGFGYTFSYIWEVGDIRKVFGDEVFNDERKSVEEIEWDFERQALNHKTYTVFDSLAEAERFKRELEAERKD